MLTHKEIRTVVHDVLASVLPKTEVGKITIRDYTDSAGEEALQITIVVVRGKSVALKGSSLTKILEGVHSALSSRGDSRFPYLRYLTANEAKQLAL